MGKDGDGSSDVTRRVFTYKSEHYSKQKVATSDEFYLNSDGKLLNNSANASQKLLLDFDAAGNIVRVVLRFDPEEEESD